jgi:hypothetical protein
MNGCGGRLKENERGSLLIEVEKDENEENGLILLPARDR